MTQSFENRIQLAAQGALQAIIQRGGEGVETGTGYSHKIEIISNGNRGIFVESRWHENGAPVHESKCFIDVLSYPDALKAGWDGAFGNILSIEHRRGRCVA